MKYLLLFIVLTFVGVLIYRRLRPYIAFARRVFGFVRTARRLNKNPTAAHAPHEPPARADEALVRCAACGAWLPTSRALVFRATKSTYCSADCIERAAGAQQRPKSASGR